MSFHKANYKMNNINLQRTDLKIISSIIEASSRVLDIGSGDGSLLAYLKEEKNVDGRGIEIKQSRVNAALSKGLAVIQGDAEEELSQYPDKSFDYVIITRTLPAARNPVAVLRHILRIGERAIISMPNFGYWKVRMHLLFKGTMPVTKTLDNTWYDTENIHLCTLKDFVSLVRKMSIVIERSYSITNEKVLPFDADDYLANIFAEDMVFILRDTIG